MEVKVKIKELMSFAKEVLKIVTLNVETCCT